MDVLWHYPMIQFCLGLFWWKHFQLLLTAEKKNGNEKDILIGGVFLFACHNRRFCHSGRRNGQLDVCCYNYWWTMFLLPLGVTPALDEPKSAPGSDTPEQRTQQSHNKPSLFGAIISVGPSIHVVVVVQACTKEPCVAIFLCSKFDQYVDCNSQRCRRSCRRNRHWCVKAPWWHACTPKNLVDHHSNQAGEPGYPPYPRDKDGNNGKDHAGDCIWIIVGQTHAALSLNIAARIDAIW